MRKKSRNILIISVISLVILFAILQFNGFIDIKSPFAITPPLASQLGQCTGGSTYFSIDKIDIGGDNKIRIFGKTGGSECMKIQLSQSQLDSYLKEKGYDATKDIFGSITLKKYTRTFPITPRDNYFIVNYMNYGLANTRTAKATIDYCKSNGYPNTIFAYKPDTFSNIRCVQQSLTDGKSGYFSSAGYDDFQIEFNIMGQIGSLDRTNLASGISSDSISLGNIGYIEWTGNLESLDRISTPPYEARLINSQWQLIDNSAYSIATTASNTFISCLKFKNPGWTTGIGYMPDSDFNSCLSSFKTSILNSGYSASKIDVYKSSLSQIIFDANTDSNALYVSMKATPFPTFILDLNAESVGIVPLTGIPKISNCIESQTLTSGINKIASFSVYNEGTSDNVQFYGGITCANGLTASISPFQINSKETKTITTELIPINTNTETSTGACTIKIIDTKSQKSDTCSFSNQIKYNSGVTCQADSTFCSTDKKSILKCNSEGTNYETLEKCDNNCEIISGGVKCAGSSNEYKESSCKWYNPICWFKGINNILRIVKWIVLVIGSIFSLFYSKGILEKIFKKKDKTTKVIIWIMSILVGAGVAFALYLVLLTWIFWLIIIGLIAFFIILNFTPFGRKIKLLRG